MSSGCCEDGEDGEERHIFKHVSDRKKEERMMMIMMMIMADIVIKSEKKKPTQKQVDYRQTGHNRKERRQSVKRKVSG